MKKTIILICIFIAIRINTLISQGNDLPLSFFNLSDSIFNLKTLVDEEISQIKIIEKHIELLDFKAVTDSTISLILLNDAFLFDSLIFDQKNIGKTCKYVYENGLSKIICMEYYDSSNKNIQTCNRMKSTAQFKNGMLEIYEESIIDSQNIESKIITREFIYGDKSVLKENVNYNYKSNEFMDTTVVINSYDEIGRLVNEFIDPAYLYDNASCQYLKLPYSIIRSYEYKSDSIIETLYNIHHLHGNRDTIKTFEQGVLIKKYDTNLKITTRTSNGTKINSMIFRDSISNLLFEYKYGEIKKTKYYKGTDLPEKVYIFYDDSIDLYLFEYK